MSHSLFKLSREELFFDLYHAYLRARRHKTCSLDQQRFELNLETELTLLTEELFHRTYKPRSENCFVIQDPKKREVFAADFRDRVVHHLYYHYTHLLFERTFIADAYSCIENRGTHYGIDRLSHHIKGESQNYRNPCYILKVDIKGYFMHINRQRLLTLCLNTLERQRSRCVDSFKPWDAEHDFEFVCYLTKIFVMQNPLAACVRRGNQNDWKELPPSKSLFFSPSGCGLPIGNLTSQLFSNVYMNVFDQYCKRVLHCHRYGRYVDDAYVVSSDKQWLKSLVPKMHDFLHRELSLELHPNKVRIDSAARGVSFLGTYLKPWRIYVYNDTIRRMKRKIRAINVDAASPHYLRSSISSFAGVFAHRKGKWMQETTLIGANPRLIQKGLFSVDMRHYQLYRSVVRQWYKSLQNL